MTDSTETLPPFNNGEWFNWQQPASPLVLGLTFDACAKPFRDFYGLPFFTSVLYYRTLDGDRGYQASWLLRFAEGAACGRLLTDALSVPSFRLNFDRLVDECFASVGKLTDSIHSTDLSEFPEPEFLALYNDYCAKFSEMYIMGAVTEPVQWHVEGMVKAFLDRQAKEETFTKWTREELESALLSMSAESYALGIEREAIEVAKALDEIGKPSEIGQSIIDDAETFLQKNVTVSAAAQKHAHKFFWKANNYRDTRQVSAPDVVRELERTAKDQPTFAGPLQDIVETADERREQLSHLRAEILSVCPDLIRTAVRICDDYGNSLADRRKSVMLHALSGLDSLIQEIAQRTNTDVESVKLLTPIEVPAFLKSPKTYETRFVERKFALVQIQSPFPLEDSEMAALLSLASEPGLPHKNDITLAEGANAIDLLHKVDFAMGLFDQPGEPGTTRGDVITKPKSGNTLEGIVRIVTDPHTDHLSSGEILVATSTTPDFMTAIKNAGALVVDQGGALSHAALTSRELGKPCIVGAGIATSIFQNGDKVSIDFETGVISRISA